MATESEARNTLIGVIVTIFLHLFSVVCLSAFMTKMWRELSIHFLINIASVFVGIILSFPWNMELLIDSVYNKLLTFWLATASFGWLLCVSLTITFLTMDRICTIKLAHVYTSHRRKQLAAVNVTSQALLYIGFILMQCAGGVPSTDETTDCFLYLCATPHAVNFLAIKLGLGFVNAMGGAVFFYYLYSYNKTRNNVRCNQRRTNLIGLFVVFIELFLNSIPHLLSYLTAGTPYHTGKTAGPYTIYLYGIETFLLTCVNLRIIGSPFGSRSSSNPHVRSSSKAKTTNTVAPTTTSSHGPIQHN